jgi:hypothetical protein
MCVLIRYTGALGAARACGERGCKSWHPRGRPPPTRHKPPPSGARQRRGTAVAAAVAAARRYRRGGRCTRQTWPGAAKFQEEWRAREGGGEKSEKVEQLLQGPIAHKVSLHILCVREAGEGRRKEGGERGGASVCDTDEAQLRFGGEMVGTGFREVLMQRSGRVGVVWEEGGGGRRVEEGERVVDLEMSEVPSEEAAWGKLK